MKWWWLKARLDTSCLGFAVCLSADDDCREFSCQYLHKCWSLFCLKSCRQLSVVPACGLWPVDWLYRWFCCRWSAVSLWFQMKWTEVVQDCSKAVDLNPRYVKALFRRAKALEKQDNKKECLEGETPFCPLKMFYSFEFVTFSFCLAAFVARLVLQMSQRCAFWKPSRTSRACC